MKFSKDIKGTQWEEAINKEENKDFYEWVGERIDYFE